MISGVDCSKIWIWFTSFNFFSGCSRYRRSSRAASREARRIGPKASTGNTAPPYLPVDMHIYRKIVYVDVRQTYNVTYIYVPGSGFPGPLPSMVWYPPLAAKKIHVISAAFQSHRYQTHTIWRTYNIYCF